MYKMIVLIILSVLLGCSAEADLSEIDDVMSTVPVQEEETHVDVTATVVSNPAVYANVKKVEKEESEPVPFNIDCYSIGFVLDGPRKVSIAYEDCADKRGLNASSVATLAKLFMDVWEEREYPNLDKVKEHLSRFMVVSLHSDGQTRSPEMARIKFPDLYSEDPVAALEKLGDGDAFCFPNGNPRYVDVSEGAKFFIVLGSHILIERWADIVVHEIAHAGLHSAYGDADGGHLRDDIWLGHSANTVLDEVLSRFAG